MLSVIMLSRGANKADYINTNKHQYLLYKV
jgi:hypothetical protein